MSILSIDDVETASGVVAAVNDDNDDDDVLRLSSVERDGNDDVADDR
jgi:hypothetical protein